MHCRRCGATLFVPERCDSCGAVRGEEPATASSTTWITLTWALVAVMTLFLGLALYRLVVAVQLLGFMRSWNGSAATLDAARLLRLVNLDEDLARFVVFGVVAYLILFVIWMRALRRAVAAAGESPKRLTRHWAFIAWRVGTFATLAFVLVTATTNPDAPVDTVAGIRDQLIAIEQRQVTYGWIRIALAAILVVAVVALYRRVRTLHTAQA